MSSLPSYPSDQLRQNNPPSPVDAGLDPSYTSTPPADSGDAFAGMEGPGEGRGPMARMRSTLEQARRRLPEFQDRARSELYRADDYVRMHPYQALGVAALIGAALGLMIGGRRR